MEFIKRLRVSLVRGLLTEHIPRTTQLRVNIRQLTARTGLSQKMAIAGTIIAVSIFFSFYNGRYSLFLYIGFSSTISSYILLFYASHKWITTEKKEIKYKKYTKIFQLIQFTLGISWGILIISGVILGDSQQRGFAYALSIALISTTMVSGTARYAISFWIPITLCSFFAVLYDVKNFYAPIFIALLCYAFISIYYILMSNRKMYQLDYSLFLVDAQSQTINLLLKDFQEGSGSFLWETDGSGYFRNLNNGGLISELLEKKNDLSLYNVLECIEQSEILENENDITRLKNNIFSKSQFNDIKIYHSINNIDKIYSLYGKPLQDEDGVFIGYRGLYTDITDKELIRKKIEFDAKHDYLTKLLNRLAFNDFIEKLPESENFLEYTLLCIDLDKFKSVNDTFGHSVGDEILKSAAKRMTSCIRNNDLIFRLGGDEFAIVLSGSDSTHASSIAQRIIQILSSPFRVEGATITIGASIGIALIDRNVAAGELVHKSADFALYRAKAAGRGVYCFADDRVDESIEYTMELQQEIMVALEHQEISVAYQPIVDLSTGNVVAAEALLRWTHPRYGDISPEIFIPILEQSGQISRFWRFVVREALETLVLSESKIRMAINLSPIQLANNELPDDIESLIQFYDTRPGQIEFEVTETSLLYGDTKKLEVLHKIRSLGCRICLDDFGTGHSSLRLLDEFPFDKIKIDGSFVSCIDESRRRNYILRSMIRLGRELGVSVTGEGVENEQQVTRLTEFGCTEGQGFFFFRPAPRSTLLEILRARRNEPLDDYNSL